jgi:hypothetical protein
MGLMHGRCECMAKGIVTSAVVALSPSSTFTLGSPYKASHMVNTLGGHRAPLSALRQTSGSFRSRQCLGTGAMSE